MLGGQCLQRCSSGRSAICSGPAIQPAARMEPAQGAIEHFQVHDSVKSGTTFHSFTLQQCKQIFHLRNPVKAVMYPHSNSVCLLRRKLLLSNKSVLTSVVCASVRACEYEQKALAFSCFKGLRFSKSVSYFNILKCPVSSIDERKKSWTGQSMRLNTEECWQWL